MPDPVDSAIVSPAPAGRSTTRGWCAAPAALGLGSPRRGAEHREHVERGVGGRERAYAVGRRKLAIVDVVVLQIGCDADPHRLPVRHRHLDVDPARRLSTVGHQRPHERRTQPTVDHRLQRRVEHRLAIQFNADRSDGTHLAAVAGEPDRIDLAGAVILRDDTAGTAERQTSAGAVPVTGRDVEIAAASIEARHLQGLGAGAQIRQPIQSAVGVPAHQPGVGAGDDGLGARTARARNTGNARQQQGVHRRNHPNRHRHSTTGYFSPSASNGFSGSRAGTRHEPVSADGGHVETPRQRGAVE
ncbi:hypothetical protein C1Y40_00241 [Mycobacterium talmoniae]|uniref:Uncharacterized protein n=1 Tax=Mycobacterium talmoniae TaxID=1858794 RepID=A0A2S8BS75_9MYCO|nr:hypothetical protein C1Y40_00241 [Mycobacterium talmoniae]